MVSRLRCSLALASLACSCHATSGGQQSPIPETPDTAPLASQAVPTENTTSLQEPVEPPRQPAKPLRPQDTRSPSAIQKVLTEERAHIRKCYDEALKTNPGIAGDLVVAFVVHADGTVKSAEINWPESDIHVPELEECALARVREFIFPASSRGMESRVNYPYNFNPNR